MKLEELVVSIQVTLEDKDWLATADCDGESAQSWEPTAEQAITVTLRQLIRKLREAKKI